MILMVVLGTFLSADLVWSIASICSGIVSIINLISILCMRKQAINILKDYEKQIRAGIDPVFIPENCAIKGADIWNDIVNEKYSEAKNIYEKTFK